MRRDLPDVLPLICPLCRAHTERGREMHSLTFADVFAEDAGGVREAELACSNSACRGRYPVVDGIPIVVPSPATFMRGSALQVLEGDLEPETQALLALHGADDDAWPHLLDHLSVYLDTHWGDRAEPAPDGPSPQFGMQALAERLREATAERVVESAVELGCSVGRGLAELSSGAKRVVGIDLSFGALRRARRVLAGEPLAYARKQAGRHYRPAIVRAGDRAAPEVMLVCGDALDPPLAPAAFDRAVALNLIDSVHSPVQLLSVVDGLLKPGGELILASPYAWQSGIVGEAHRLGGADPAEEVTRRLREGDELEARYEIEDEADLPWWLRRDSRSGNAYSVHWLRARKL